TSWPAPEGGSFEPRNEPGVVGRVPGSVLCQRPAGVAEEDCSTPRSQGSGHPYKVGFPPLQGEVGEVPRARLLPPRSFCADRNQQEDSLPHPAGRKVLHLNRYG